jgi:hypothetical protein
VKFAHYLLGESANMIPRLLVWRGSSPLSRHGFNELPSTLSHSIFLFCILAGTEMSIFLIGRKYILCIISDPKGHSLIAYLLPKQSLVDVSLAYKKVDRKEASSRRNRRPIGGFAVSPRLIEGRVRHARRIQELLRCFHSASSGRPKTSNSKR